MSTENKSLAEQIKKAVDAGVGLAQKTWDEVEARGKDIIKKAKLPEKEAAGLLKGFQSSFEQTQKKIEERVGQVVRDGLKKADVVTAEDLKSVRREILALKKDFQAMRAPKRAKARKPASAKAAAAPKAPRAAKRPAAGKAAKASPAPKRPETTKAPKAVKKPRPPRAKKPS